MRTVYAQKNKKIILGRQGEDKAVRVVWPGIVSDWSSLYGGGSFQLSVRRFSDENAYPVAVEANGDDISFTVTSAETAIAGNGKCELTYIANGTIAKSATWETVVLNSLTGQTPSEPPEEPAKSWFTAIQGQIGNLNDLQTTSKDNLVAAINEAAKSGGGGGASIALDTTLTQSGKAADAKAVGDALAEKQDSGNYVKSVNGTTPDASGNVTVETGGVSNYTELTNKPKINGVELSGDKTSADLGIGNPTDEQVASSVEAWLDAHPEATTTVADGSINPDKTTWMRQVWHNIFDVSTITDGYFFFTVSNDNTTGGGTADYFVSDYIPVVAGREYVFSHKNMALRWTDANKTFISGSASTVSLVGQRVTAPDGAAFVRFSLIKSGLTPEEVQSQVYEYIGEVWEYDTYKNLYSIVVTDAGYSKAIADLVEGKFVDGSLAPADLFADESLLYKQMEGWKVFRWNIVDPATVTRTQKNQYYQYHTDFIEVEPGMILRGNWTYNFYDENKESVTSINAFRDGVVYDVIVPDGVAFVKVDSGITYSETNTIRILTPGYGKDPGYSEKMDYHKGFPVFKDEDSKEGFKAYLGVHPWADKKFGIIGDSFTAPGVWDSIMCGNLKASNRWNHAISGGAFSDYDGVPKTAYEQAQEMVTDGNTPDVILITMGTNDANNSITIGDIVQSNSISDFDLTTYTGGMQACLNYLQNNFPNAIIYVGWTPMGGLVNGTKVEYITRMQEVCLMYGVEYIETRTCGVTRFSDVYAECYENGTNGGHPTGVGQHKIGAYMTRLMLSKM